MRCNIVITMAGRGSCFRDAGYTVPKYEILAHGRSLFDWSILSLYHFLSNDSRIIFVCLAENDSSAYVQRRSQSLGLNEVHILELETCTDGQATSAYLSSELWWKDEPVLIYDIDTYVNPKVLRPADIRPGSDGWVPCFQVQGEHWSFVKLDENSWASNLAEKKRISNYASIGLYWFAQAGRYIQAYDRFFTGAENLVRGELYIAPLYCQLLTEGAKISIPTYL